MLMTSSVRVFSLFVLASIAISGAAYAQRKSSEVLLVYNADSPISTTVAKDYEAKRHITNVVTIHCADSALKTDDETISIDDYTAKIAAPVSAYLAQHKNINFIVLTKGVPIRIRDAGTGEREGGQGPQMPSLDSYLAAIDYPTLPNAVKASLVGSGTVGTGWVNHYYHASEPFTHAKFGGYLVTRLDGYTQADAMGLVDQALTAERTHIQGDILFDIEPDFGLGDKTKFPLVVPSTNVTTEEPWGDWFGDMLRMNDILEATGIPHTTEMTQKFVGDKTDLLGYFSYGSNDSHYDPQAYQSLRFLPGSMADTAVSTGGRTFLPTTGGQSLIADLIAHGVTCCQGYVGEPILDGTSSPTLDLSHYLSGYTMAESFYSGTKYIGWEGVCVGDPLCAPYIGQKLVIPTQASEFTDSHGGLKTENCSESGQDIGSISNGDYTVYRGVNFTGMTQFKARVASAGSGGKIELRLDTPTGKLIGTCPAPPTGNWQAWTTQTCELTEHVKGAHTLCLVYVGGDGNLFNLEWFAFKPTPALRAVLANPPPAFGRPLPPTGRVISERVIAGAFR
ncbi:hypothetical protein CCAX7_56900 [Capsulimonas corticalis]|uniref:Uncharacterized protein n=1 Tax=Capsulimonas corticalis TaxID=2219043 RepID=A0A402D0I8_9BACT|nr:TIGR03790 family protein [Capsulimonas corticalis]BDI33639.1 hypothetical protein CCAX7_56900 [Capsulimonas corticalis]